MSSGSGRNSYYPNSLYPFIFYCKFLIIILLGRLAVRGVGPGGGGPLCLYLYPPRIIVNFRIPYTIVSLIMCHIRKATKRNKILVVLVILILIYNRNERSTAPVELLNL